MKFRLFLIIASLASRSIFRVSRLCHRSGAAFYWSLAFFITVGLVFSRLTGISIGTVEGGIYDTVLKMRWSSPPPSPQVIILDIDEKSLAEMAPKHGRWPWKREIIAQALAEIESAGPKSVILNILFTDKDIGREGSDAILQAVAADTTRTSYPLVRLPPANDGNSQLRVGSITGVKLTGGENPTVAVLLPFLEVMQKSMGVANLVSDEDGILRRYELEHVEEKWSMPTLVGRAVQLSGQKELLEKDSYYLNWRNKRGAYQRISFTDYFHTLEGGNRVSPDIFKGKHVIIGTSAPGISTLKPTSISPASDDNEILAVAVDDAVNQTGLRKIPHGFVSLLAVIFVWFLAFLFASGKAPSEKDIIFGTLQVVGMGMMFVAASYTRYFIDLTPVLTAGLLFFGVASIHSALDKRVVKGSPEQFAHISKLRPKSFSVMAFKNDLISSKKLNALFRKLEKIFGQGFVIIVQEVFVADHAIGALNDVSCLIVLSRDEIRKNSAATLSEMIQKECPDMKEEVDFFDIPDALASDEIKLRRLISKESFRAMGKIFLSE